MNFKFTGERTTGILSMEENMGGNYFNAEFSRVFSAGAAKNIRYGISLSLILAAVEVDESMRIDAIFLSCIPTASSRLC